MSKKKVSFKLEEGEAYLIAPLASFDHIVECYESQAESAESLDEKMQWLKIADWIRTFTHDTHYQGEIEEEDEW